MNGSCTPTAKAVNAISVDWKLTARNCSVHNRFKWDQIQSVTTNQGLPIETDKGTLLL